MWAVVIDGIVTQVLPQPMAFTIGDVQYPAQWFYSTTTEEKAVVGVLPIVQDTILPGTHATGSTYEVLADHVQEHFTIEADPLPSKDALKNYTENKELAVEQSGIDYFGVAVPTDRESQGMISRAAAYAQAPDPITRRFHVKTRSGAYALVPLEEMGGIARAVEEHVLTAIDAAAVIAQDIDAGAITTYDEIETSPLWPAVPPPPENP